MKTIYNKKQSPTYTAFSGQNLVKISIVKSQTILHFYGLKCFYFSLFIQMQQAFLKTKA